MGDRKAVMGVYASDSDLQGGVCALKDAGFRNSDISVLYPNSGQQGDLADKVNASTGTTEAAPEGAATGATTGAVVGGVLGWLVGIGSLAIPGAGLFIAAGPIMAALAGITAGGAVGGIAGGLAGLGVSEQEAGNYLARLKEGGRLLSVHCDDEAQSERAKAILESTKAQHITVTSEREIQTDAGHPLGLAS